MAKKMNNTRSHGQICQKIQRNTKLFGYIQKKGAKRSAPKKQAAPKYPSQNNCNEQSEHS